MDQPTLPSEQVLESLRKVPLLHGVPEEKLRQIVEIVRQSAAELAIDTLRKVPLFEGLPDEDLHQTQAACTSRTVEKGEVLFREGEPGDAFYVVLSGSVEIVKRGPRGGEEKLAQKREGTAFGEMALLNDMPRSATARAAEQSHLLVLSRSAFYELLGGETLALRLLQSLAKALWAMDVRFATQDRGSKPVKLMVWGLSRVLQRALLPRDAPRVNGYDLAVSTALRKDGCGSAIWDAFPLQDGRVALAALSVQGDGFPAGHYLAIARALFRELARDQSDIAVLLRRANAALAASLAEAPNQRVDCGLLALGSDEFDWASAGNAPAAVLRRQGLLEELAAAAPSLGAGQDPDYRTQRVRIAPGDAILLLADAPPEVARGARVLVATMREEKPEQVASSLQDALLKAGDKLGTEHDMIALFLRRRAAASGELDILNDEIAAQIA